MDKTMTIVKDGKEVKCEIIFTYYSEEYKKNYVIFKPEDENVLSAMSYIDNGDNSGMLNAIESDDEWNMLEEVLNDYYENNGNACSCDSCEGCSGCNSCEDLEA